MRDDPESDDDGEGEGEPAEAAFVDVTYPDHPGCAPELRNRPRVDVFYVEYLEAAERYIVETYPDIVGIVRTVRADRIDLRGQYHPDDRWIGPLFVIKPDDV